MYAETLMCLEVSKTIYFLYIQTYEIIYGYSILCLLTQ
jgi:hypothetical protein